MEYMLYKAVAEKFGVSVAAISKWVQKGVLTEGPRVGKAKSVTIESVEEKFADATFMEGVAIAKGRVQQQGGSVELEQLQHRITRLQALVEQQQDKIDHLMATVERQATPPPHEDTDTETTSDTLLGLNLTSYKKNNKLYWVAQRTINKERFQIRIGYDRNQAEEKIKAWLRSHPDKRALLLRVHPELKGELGGV